MDKVRLEYLVKRLLFAKLSEQQERELTELMTNNPDQQTQELFASIYEKYKTDIPFPADKHRAIWNNIHQQVAGPKANWNLIISIAAAIALFFSALLGIYVYNNPGGILQETALVKPIYLKKGQASIFLADEFQKNQLVLTDQQLAQYGVSIDTAGTIYIADQQDKATLANFARLTIKSSQGQVQAVVLPDHSKVWLNSSSAVTIPNHFSGLKREVQLKGEAYFEVTKHQFKPFHVTAGELDTEVLGTHFTISSNDNQETKVTLIEGKVKVSNNRDSLLLTAGEQVVGNEASILKMDVDTLDLLAWRDGYFKFDNTSTREIMNQIKDWYDVKYVKIDATSEERFSGTYKKTNQLNDLLQSLEKVSNITFRIEEGGIHVVDK
ncbi:MAG: FecR family protein [Sphingobacterium sp.]